MVLEVTSEALTLTEAGSTAVLAEQCINQKKAEQRSFTSLLLSLVWDHSLGIHLYCGVLQCTGHKVSVCKANQLQATTVTATANSLATTGQQTTWWGRVPSCIQPRVTKGLTNCSHPLVVSSSLSVCNLATSPTTSTAPLWMLTEWQGHAPFLLRSRAPARASFFRDNRRDAGILPIIFEQPHHVLCRMHETVSTCDSTWCTIFPVLGNYG
jgi:hypothetical protein